MKAETIRAKDLTPTKLAELLRGWRAGRGINTEEAGELLGLSARTIEGIEQGRGFGTPMLLVLALCGLEQRKNIQKGS